MKVEEFLTHIFLIVMQCTSFSYDNFDDDLKILKLFVISINHL